MKTALILLILIPFASQTQVPGFEFHGSVNQPLSGERTFFGAGVGANILFRETKRVNFKTGIEGNFFHTWEANAFKGKNAHHQYGVISVPAMVRFTFGEKSKLFVESGVYLGIGYGETRTDYYTFYGSYRYEDYFPGLVITPALGLGGRFSFSERMDLFLKPEFAFTVTEFDPYPISFGTSYFYARFCAGIHLKPRPKKPAKNGVIKIEPLHP
ncbi:hypothetical protein [Fluviicola sp.]|uniref:hypothetical protein n=1 Tax=Fluviicola sp. TaxID=1917219 RepID=UPI0031E2CE3F